MDIGGELKHLGRLEILEYLDKIGGTKTLVWDSGLTAAIDLVVSYSELKTRDVLNMVVISPEDNKIPSNSDVFRGQNTVFIVRPHLPIMDAIAEVIRNQEQIVSDGDGERPDLHLLFVPARSLLCEKRLVDQGVFGSFTFVEELPLFWFPLENDVLSMEEPSIFRKYHLDLKPSALHPVAKGLTVLEALFGDFPQIYGKGKAAKEICDQMSRMRKESGGKPSNFTSKFDQVLILDRQIDLITPLMTQLTYEGLIDELIEIKQNGVFIPAQVKLGESDNRDEAKKVILNGKEELYAEIRDSNFNAVGPLLSHKAKTINAQFNETKESTSVKDLKNLVSKLPGIKALKESLVKHTAIAEVIKSRTNDQSFLDDLRIEQELVNCQSGGERQLDSLEDACLERESVFRVLRLMCLQSLVNGGLKPKLLEYYRRLILQTFGYKHLTSLDNLEKMGMLSAQQNSRNYAVIRKRLNLTVDSVDEQDPEDIAFAYSVYAPLSIRLVERLSTGWKSIRDVLDLLPGPTVEETRPEARRARVERERTAGIGATTKILVVFVGGCTFAEIAALRFLSKREGPGGAVNEYLVATTGIINGDRIMRSVTSESNSTS